MHVCVCLHRIYWILFKFHFSVCVVVAHWKKRIQINPCKRICDVKINIHDDHQFSQARLLQQQQQRNEIRARISGGMTGIMMMVWNDNETFIIFQKHMNEIAVFFSFSRTLLCAPVFLCMYCFFSSQLYNTMWMGVGWIRNTCMWTRRAEQQ